MSIKENTEQYFKDKPKLKKVFKVVISILAIVFFFTFSFKLFYIIPIVIIITALLPSRRKKFFKLQAVLPTSKINALAMGVVEIEGELEQMEPLVSPYFSEPCIGYLYTIEEERKDKDNNTTWHTVHTECKTGVFRINDETGTVLVNGEGLEYYSIDEGQQVESGFRRHTESYLKHKDYMLLIGCATSDEGSTVIKNDEHHNVFGISDPNQISLRNKYMPLLNSFLTTLFFLTIIIVFIILN